MSDHKPHGFTIDRDVPMPKTHKRSKYPFDQCEDGDSFFVPTTVAGLYGMRGACTRQNKRATGKQFRAREVEGGCRVWCSKTPNQETE